eukprot:gene1943-2984_t
MSGANPASGASKQRRRLWFPAPAASPSQAQNAWQEMSAEPAVGGIAAIWLASLSRRGTSVGLLSPQWVHTKPLTRHEMQEFLLRSPSLEDGLLQSFVGTGTHMPMVCPDACRPFQLSFVRSACPVLSVLTQTRLKHASDEVVRHISDVAGCAIKRLTLIWRVDLDNTVCLVYCSALEFLVPSGAAGPRLPPSIATQVVPSARRQKAGPAVRTPRTEIRNPSTVESTAPPVVQHSSLGRSPASSTSSPASSWPSPYFCGTSFSPPQHANPQTTPGATSIQNTDSQ